MRLARREATLLDREVDRVAGGVHIGEVLSRAVLVELEQVIRSRGRYAGGLGAARERQRHGVVRRPRSACHAARGDELDPRRGQQVSGALAALTAEEGQASILRTEETQLDSLDVVPGEVARGHQRKLMQRQQPPGRAGRNERGAAGLAAAQPLEQLLDRAGPTFDAERDRIGKGAHSAALLGGGSARRS
jgi:hypothetical protein